MNLACIVGARPNFMKMAPILRALEAYPDVNAVLIHTGQHYDASLSQVFFDELEIKAPDISLEVGSGKHGAQTAKIIERCEEVFEKGPPRGGRYNRLVVVGDVNSTMGAALAAVKLGIPVAHVEAGLRSFDRSMPEEINRIVTDSIADMLLVSEPVGIANLRREGHPEDHLHLVGNVMIDTLLRLLPKVKQRETLKQHGLAPGAYGLITLHRPANVDHREKLGNLVDLFIDAARRLPLAFPIHPRTQQRLVAFGLAEKLAACERIVQLPPLGYLDFLALSSQAKVIITDSGGIQEESTALGVPCLTMRSNTERPITVDQGSSTLVGDDFALLRRCLNDVVTGSYKNCRCPKNWDGSASERIAAILVAAAKGPDKPLFR